MFVNRVVFLISISQSIRFGTCELLANQTHISIDNILKLYSMGGYLVSKIHMDGQFEGIQEKIIGQNIWFNVTSRNDQVPKIERYILTVKERARCILNELPFKKLPVRITAEMIYNVIFWLNSFHSQNRILGTLGPRKIITGQDIIHKAHCILEFGSYVQVQEEHRNNNHRSNITSP